MNPWASRTRSPIPFKVLQKERGTRLNFGSDWWLNYCWCGWASSSPTFVLHSSPLSEPYLSHNVQTHMLQLSRCDHMPEECNSSRSFSLSLSDLIYIVLSSLSPLPRLLEISFFPPLQLLVAPLFLHLLFHLSSPHMDTDLRLTGQNTNRS